MNLELFIAKRMRSNRHYKNSVSNRIIKIAISSVAIGLIMILMAVSTGLGFQNEIKNKTSSFSGHISVAPFENNNSLISITPFDRLDSRLINSLQNAKIKNVHAIATKAVILKKNTDFEGIIFKGLSENYNWKNILPFIVEGEFPELKNELKNQVLLSKKIADRLSLSIGDNIESYFENNNSSFPLIRNFKLVGLFETGFPDFDNNYGITDIRHIQKINRWKQNQIGGLEIFLNDINEVELVADQVYRDLPSELDAISVKYKFKSIYDWIALFDFNS